VASFVGFGGVSIGDLTGDGTADITAPTAGLTRLVDLLVADRQLPSDDQLSMWDGATRMPLSGSPQAVADLAFFVQPAIADLDGDGTAESIAGTSTNTLSAFSGSGAAPDGWPKLTGGWMVGTPAIGDWDADGTLEVAAVRRDGVLLVWSAAPGSATDSDAVAWSQWGCDSYHSGSCVDTAAAPIEPEPPASTTTSTTTVTTETTTAPTTSSPAPTDPSEVQGASAAGGATTSTGSLPVTGAATGTLVLVGIALVVAGRFLVRRARRTD